MGLLAKSQACRRAFRAGAQLCDVIGGRRRLKLAAESSKQGAKPTREGLAPGSGTGIGGTNAHEARRASLPRVGCSPQYRDRGSASVAGRAGKRGSSAPVFVTWSGNALAILPEKKKSDNGRLVTRSFGGPTMSVWPLWRSTARRDRQNKGAAQLIQDAEEWAHDLLDTGPCTKKIRP
ncbi:hypothetical protein VUR80DRAFT_3558 [Thermomyces stellatus]